MTHKSLEDQTAELQDEIDYAKAVLAGCEIRRHEFSHYTILTRLIWEWSHPDGPEYPEYFFCTRRQAVKSALLWLEQRL